MFYKITSNNQVTQIGESQIKKAYMQEITKEENDTIAREFIIANIKVDYNNGDLLLQDVEKMLSDGKVTQEEYDEIVGGAV